MIAGALGFLMYMAAASWLAATVARGHVGARGWAVLAAGAMALHALVHALDWRATGGADLHFFAALSLVTLGMAALTTAVGVRGRMALLGVVVYPLAALALVAHELRGNLAPIPLDWRLQLHAWLALLSYATLGIAALLAVMLWLQERALRRRHLHGWLRALPSLVELETLLFRSIQAGFVLLTATLLTGVLFVHDLLGQHLVHKTVLSALSWVVFGALLAGRWRYGWRGRTAVRWTLVAMFLLVLGFFGSKFVLEVVLGIR